jgi:uncharacterized membrane protein YoaK (UPF0700 family)
MQTKPHHSLPRRILRFVALLLASWVVMTFTHEIGHIIGGTCCGGELKSADLWPWHLPYSLFDPDPFPLITLWSGLLIGVFAPLVLAVLIQRETMWFIAHFCVLANGTYIAAAWVTGDRYLDTPKLLEHGASPVSILIYCVATIGCGYAGFRGACQRVFSAAAVSPVEPRKP